MEPRSGSSLTARLNEYWSLKERQSETRVTSRKITFMDIGALDDQGGPSMKLDLFEGSLWRKKLSGPSNDGSVTVTLSTGKSVTVNSRFLGLLRVLAEELAKHESKPH